MRNSTRHVLPSSLLVLLVTCAGPRPLQLRPTGVDPATNPFLHAVGRDLFDGQGRRVLLRGIAFGNDVWANGAVPPKAHHDEASFAAMHALGMNAVRFYLSYRFFEDDATPYVYEARTFEWLDENFAWARRNGVYLVLNMHVPQGGWQSMGNGGALWRDPENQARFVALWRAIARRYSAEPALGGYDLLNEPMPTKSIGQWGILAAKTVRAIRDEDPAHAVFVERAFAVGEAPSPDYAQDQNGQMNYLSIADTNVVYELHFYEPWPFTYQGASWIPVLANVQVTYPGPFRDFDGVVKTGDRSYLSGKLAPHIAFARKRNVPLFIGEFGALQAAFADGRNGAGWARDVIDLALDAGVNLTYHAYHETYFGFCANAATEPPAQCNHALAKVFAETYPRAPQRPPP